MTKEEIDIIRKAISLLSNHDEKNISDVRLRNISIESDSSSNSKKGVLKISFRIA